MYKICSLFAGVGGIELGFLQTKKCEVIYVNEYDLYAVKTYESNFNLSVDTRDIRNVHVKEIPDFDILVAGFPCTSFSIAGHRKGFEDETHGDLFFELERIFKHKKPRVIFLENVKNLVSHDKGRTFKIIIDSLEKAGYKNKIVHKVLNASEYGNLPQNRERIYIVAFKDKDDYEKFKMPSKIKLTNTIKKVLNFNDKVDEKYYYTEGKYKQEIYQEILKNVKRSTTTYQWRRKYVRENKNGLIPTLTANMGAGGHNVPLIKTKHGIRKLTPKECFLAQGFPEDYILPNDLADSRLYKQAGNSVAVPVIYRIAKNIIKSIS